MKFLIAILWIVVMVGVTVWATKHGSPQHIWMFCDVLGWCHR
jgi:hypothetical protein